MMDLPKSFGDWLFTELSVSEKTLRNYLSDFSHFTGWTLLRLKTNGFSVLREEDIIAYITPHLFEEYKHFLVSNRTPTSTINRRLSTLRHFGRFLHKNGIVEADPTEDILNLTVVNPKKEMEILLSNFKKHLENDGASPKTVRNYLSDARGFLTYLGRE